MDKLKPLRTWDGYWHNAASHADPMNFRRRMESYRAAYGRPEHNPQPVANAEIVKLTKRK